MTLHGTIGTIAIGTIAPTERLATNGVMAE